MVSAAPRYKMEDLSKRNHNNVDIRTSTSVLASYVESPSTIISIDFIDININVLYITKLNLEYHIYIFGIHHSKQQ